MKKNFTHNLHFAALLFFSLFSILHSANAQPTSQTFNSSGTYTVPAGWTAIVTVEVWGAGGSGGGGNASKTEMGGGGGGGYAKKILTLAAGNYAVTVGTGGIAPPNVPAGQDGGNSNFAGLVSANGGKGANDNTSGTGGSGVAGAGITIFSGGNGGTGLGPGGGGGGSAFATANGSDGANSTNILPGAGGAGQGPGGSGGADNGGSGVSGISPGGGGGGKGDKGVRSGNGANGRVIVTVNLIPLPVKLTDFSAKYDKQFITLAWKSSQEINFSYYVLERSNDGNIYATISQIFGKAQNEGGADYSVVDRNVSGNSGLIYYRLKMVDIDGKFTYSDVRIVRLKEQSQTIGISAYPNPVISEIHINIPNTWQGKKVTYTVFNSNGQLLKKSTFSNSNHTEMVNVNDLAPGIYLVRATCNGEEAQQKVIKQ
jgi:Secretion system C-terminal sorting domain